MAKTTILYLSHCGSLNEDVKAQSNVPDDVLATLRKGLKWRVRGARPGAQSTICNLVS